MDYLLYLPKQHNGGGHDQLLSHFLLFFISMDHRPPGFSARWISQARTLRFVSILSSRRSIFPTQGFLNPGSSTLGGGFFTTEPPGQAPKATQYLFKTQFLVFICIVSNFQPAQSGLVQNYPSDPLVNSQLPSDPCLGASHMLKCN